MKKKLITCVLSSFVFVSFLSSCSKEPDDNNLKNDTRYEQEVDYEVVEEQEVIVPEQGDIIEYTQLDNIWTYGIIEDGIRGNRKFAKIQSVNSHDVGNGDYPLTMIVRQKEPNKDFYEIILESNGIFYCTRQECKITARFDESVMPYYYSNEITGKMNVIFIKSYGHFYQSLKDVNEVVIEAPFLNFGNKQFIFNASGLDIENY